MTVVLRLTSLQAPHADPNCRRLAGYLADRLRKDVHFVDEEPWQARERLLDNGGIDVAWICGLPYVRRRDQGDASLELLAAPVMEAPRYEGRPIYFSDVVVRHDSRWKTFSELRGARWAYNEPDSHSGHCLTRFELARAGYGSTFFGSAVEAGSHESALELLLRGEVDATGLDSTVLEAVQMAGPELKKELRVVATWGPSPIPPWVVANHVDEDTRQHLQDVMTSMHKDPIGSEILREAQMARFIPVEDAEYDPIRRMARAAESVTL